MYLPTLCIYSEKAHTVFCIIVVEYSSITKLLLECSGLIGITMDSQNIYVF